MAISTSKTEIYAEGTTDISWTNLQSNLGAQDPTNIRFGAYKRDTSDAEDPLIPDATENENIGTEESGNLRVGAFRGAIRDHTVTFDDASEYENVQFDKYFGANLIKNVPKQLNIDGIVYSYDVDEPAAKIETDSSVRNLTVGIGTSGAIYGAGASATTASQGIAGGTALYVDADSNSRNFKINLESSGGSFGKLYGGGGGGVTGNSGTTQSRSSCARNQDNSYSYTQPRTCYTTAYNPTYPGNTNPMNRNMHWQPSIHPGLEPSRDWDWRAERHCRTYYNGGNSYGGHPAGGRGYGHGYYSPGVRNGHPYYVQGQWAYYCNFPGNTNPTRYGTAYSQPYGCSVSIYVPRSRSDAGSITSPGGTGGPGGKGQGYQRAYESGTAGEIPSTVSCSQLGTLFSGPSVKGGDGSAGTSGGDWGQPGESSEIATGGLAGYAYKKSDSSIDIEIIGGDDDRLKGRNN
jgi:hypothetical protein